MYKWTIQIICLNICHTKIFFFGESCKLDMSCSDFCVNGSGQTAFYIESECYVKYDAKMSWFGARNDCLAKHGDLAYFSQLSLLQGQISSNNFWVGLRNNKWQWQNAGK